MGKSLLKPYTQKPCIYQNPTLQVVPVSLQPISLSASQSSKFMALKWDKQDMGGRGAIPDKWSMRVLWFCALGSAVDRQIKNRERMMAENLKAMEGEGGGEDV
ncbi:hypothetical protein CFP56_030490 [Quercus suber]|uniref:Uncharacterized protein n=1 Tax=Quercus suber TaxID=58331 RepID=A0AAW0JMG3_QUESU